MSVTVIAEGLPDFERYLERAPAVARRAARLALNDTIERSGMKAIREAMQLQVAFPAGYLADPARLKVARRATEEKLEAAVIGQQRPTSLARFAIGGGVGKRSPVTVRVNPGRTVNLANAWLVPLRAGTREGGNVGLAVRLKEGERITNRLQNTAGLKELTALRRQGSRVFLLYGPSVDQVFRDVAYTVAPTLADNAAREFLRQFVRLSEEP